MKSYASLLYTPALRLASVSEPGRVRADMLVLDLEDSTHPARKAEARAMLAAADLRRAELPALGLRVNTIVTPDGLEDLRTLLELDAVIGGVPIDVVFIPKISGPGDVAVYRALLARTSRPPQICSFIETVDSVENAFAIAAVSDGLCFGQADLTADMYAGNPVYLDYARARLCVAAASRAARDAGFTGKAAIHPRQVEPIAEAFTVGPEELAEYRRMVADYDARISFTVEQDRVLAPPFVLRARRMLQFHATDADTL